MSTITLPNLSLARTVQGQGCGLLLAHGAGGGIDTNFGPIMPGLAERYRVVAPDLPGTGGTPRAQQPLTVDGLADELVAAAVAEGLESFAISGYSLGSALAVRAAARHPKRVTALVLTAGFVTANARFSLAVQHWRELLRAGRLKELAAFMSLLGIGTETVDRMTAADLHAAMDSAADTVPPGTPDHLDLIDIVDVRADLSRIDVPTLVISTARDNLVTPYLHRQLAEGITGAQLESIDTGHLPFVERPEQWLRLQRDFLARFAR
jgi:pimeloyl-ACP methyl ester carboxylesterase